jgi:anti-sigma B factor antagonist
MSEVLQLSSSSRFGNAVVVVKGDIDLASAPTLSAELLRLLDTAPNMLVVDLSSVSFIDAAGLGALVVAGRRADGRLRIVIRAGSRIDRLWSLCGLDLSFPLYETPKEALADEAAA